MPHPEFLVGQRVEHQFRVVEGGRKGAQNLIFTGTVTKIVKGAQNPLYTLYQIIYDVDEIDSEDEEPVKNIFEYELLTDFTNGDLTIID